MGAALRQRGARFLIDATHGAGVLAMDVRRLDPDFVIFPTYKWLLGPYGRAFLYVAKRHQGGIPLEQTAFGRRDVRAENEVYFTDVSYVPDARRFDMGERDHFISLEMASIGMEMMAEWGASAVVQRLLMLTERIAEGLRGFGVSVPERSVRAPHILSLGFRDGMPTGLVEDSPPRASTSRRVLAACASRPTCSTTRPMPTASSRLWQSGSGASPPYKKPGARGGSRVPCCATNGRMTRHDESAVRRVRISSGAPLRNTLLTPKLAVLPMQAVELHPLTARSHNLNVLP